MLFLAADIGGTHARVALMRASLDGSRVVETLGYRVFVCAQFPTLPKLLQTFIDADVRAPLKHCVLACAGQIVGDEVVNDNLAWPIHLRQLRNALGLDEVAVLNDFEALAYALDGSLAHGGRHLCGPGAPPSRGPTLVIGPGTGLGAAVHVPSPAGGFVLPTEAGQMDFASNSVREREILAHLAPDGGYVAFEHLVSGPGLLTLYTSLCTLHGESPKLATPEAVTTAAIGGSDMHALEAVEIFCAALGSFTGNLAMTFMATSVYLAGGFLSSVFELLKHSTFEERFLHGRSARTLLAQVPVWVTEHGRHGVQGAAQWYLERGMSGTATLRHAAASGVRA
ncbi:glucokinase [Dyella choica]|uniref:Glucokinase n=1 Tax=Dyella choica TaxID=1927959 RepID=A0A3S0Q5L9_9GAMM|nr:glucokinase [Dyella choica]RUL77543.1 glucokinase [Dyella choica]